MKIRLGFVSNSSSTGFIVIGKTGYYHTFKPTHKTTLVIDKSFGTTEFGWGPESIHDPESKVIFCFLQAELYAPTPALKEKWRKMTEKVIKDHCEGIGSIQWKIRDQMNLDYNDKDYCLAYIDHGTSASKGVNAQMFESLDTLRDFIFDKGSRIELRNDNDDSDINYY